MASYALPPWLNPSAAQGYGALAGEASRAALSAQIARERMSNEFAQAAMEANARQNAVATGAAAKADALKMETMKEQQRIAIEKSYHDSEIGLRQQDLDLSQKEFAQKTTQAAQSYAMKQQFSARVAAGEDPQKVLMELGPAMGLTGTALSRVTAPTFKPGAQSPVDATHKMVQMGPNRWQMLSIPETNATATAQSVTNNAGQYIGDSVKLPNGRYTWSSAKKTIQSPLEQILAARRAATNAPAAAMPMAAPTTGTATDASGGIIRVTKDGRRVLFDPQTKQALKYLDAPATPEGQSPGDGQDDEEDPNAD